MGIGRRESPGSSGGAVVAIVLCLLGLTACSSPSGTPSSTSAPSTSPPVTAASPTATGTPSPTVPVTPTSTPAPTASGAFGSAPVTGGQSPTGPAQSSLRRVAVASHTGFDRLVLDFGSDPVPDFSVTPQTSPAFAKDPSDTVVTLAGTSGVRVVVQSTVVSPGARFVVLRPRLPAIREVRSLGDFEAVVSYGIGVLGPAMVRVTTMTAPNRLVVDVAWPGRAQAVD